MNKYFEIIPDCKLYKAYFGYLENIPKINEIVKKICHEFGIESTKYYHRKDCLKIIPTKNDEKNFAGMMKKTSYGEFKKNSKVGKMWTSLVKDIEAFEKPKLMFYIRFSCRRWSERLFDVGEKLYCSVECDGEVFTPDFAIEMKASEFYKIIEDEEKKDKECEDGKN